MHCPSAPEDESTGYHGTSRVFRVRGCSVQHGTWCTALIHCTTRFSTGHFALGRVPHAHTRNACLFRGGKHVYKVDHALIPFRTGAMLFCEMNDAIFRELGRPFAPRPFCTALWKYRTVAVVLVEVLQNYEECVEKPTGKTAKKGKARLLKTWVFFDVRESSVGEKRSPGKSYPPLARRCPSRVVHTEFLQYRPTTFFP